MNLSHLLLKSCLNKHQKLGERFYNNATSLRHTVYSGKVPWHGTALMNAQIPSLYLPDGILCTLPNPKSTSLTVRHNTTFGVTSHFKCPQKSTRKWAISLPSRKGPRTFRTCIPSRTTHSPKHPRETVFRPAKVDTVCGLQPPTFYTFARSFPCPPPHLLLQCRVF